MIELEITNSPDEEIIGGYSTFKNDLIIGRSCDSDFPIEDSKLDDIHCMIRLLPTHLYIRSVPGSAQFLLNGKKFEGEKRLQIKDKVIIGDTEISVKGFLYDPTSSPGDFKDYYKKAITKYPEIALLLEVLEREISNLSEQPDDPTTVQVK